MAHVVQAPCVLCKYGDCIEVCPVDAFHEADVMLVINPITCIDCKLCVKACPVGAIVSGDKADPDWAAENANFAFSEENQCFKENGKDSITHGPNCSPDAAH